LGEPSKWFSRPEAPLAYVAGIDCAAVPAQQLDIALPTSGTLHFFTDYDCFEEEPGQHEGSRIHYVPAGVDVRERPLPPTPYPDDGPLMYGSQTLRARLIATAPDYYSAFLGAAFWRPEPDHVFGDEPYPGWVYTAYPYLCTLFSDEFAEAVAREASNQLGGYASRCDGQAPENSMWPRSDYPFRDGEAQEAGAGPGQEDPGRLLLSIDGQDLDGGDYMFHWVVRPDDLAALRFDAAFFGKTRHG
jgi:hypothetical protein